MKSEVTTHKGVSAIRSFLNGLLTSPLHTEPNQVLKDNGVTKKQLINDFLQNGIVTKKSNILDKTNSDKEEPHYQIKYTLADKHNFNDKILKMYNKYFKKLNECDGGAAGTGAVSGGDIAGATNAESSGQFLGKMKKPIRRKLYVTESQFRHIQEMINTPTAGDELIDEETTTQNVGSMGNYTANGLALNKKDPSYSRPAGGIMMQRIDEE